MFQSGQISYCLWLYGFRLVCPACFSAGLWSGHSASSSWRLPSLTYTQFTTESHLDSPLFKPQNTHVGVNTHKYLHDDETVCWWCTRERGRVGGRKWETYREQSTCQAGWLRSRFDGELVEEDDFSSYRWRCWWLWRRLVVDFSSSSSSSTEDIDEDMDLPPWASDNVWIWDSRSLLP